MMDLETDSRLFVSITEILSNAIDYEEIFDSLERLKRVRNDGDQAVKFCTRANMLMLLLVYTLPTTIKSRELFLLAQVACEKGEAVNGDGEVEDLVDLMVERTHVARESDEEVIQVAEMLLADAEKRSREYGFVYDVHDGHKGIMLRFLRAKIVSSSPYLDSFAYFNDFFQYLDGYEPFDAWYEGIIGPYIYYWDNFGRLDPDGFVIFEDFAQTQSISSTIEILIEPLNLIQFRRSLKVKEWIKNAILPVLAYFDDDFHPLLHWLYSSQKWKTKNFLSIFQTSHEVILASTNNPQVSSRSYLDLVRNFLASCYYYSTQFDSKAPSMELTQIYDSIKSTLLAIGAVKCDVPKVHFDGLQNSDSFESFVKSSTSPIQPLMNSGLESAGVLLSIVDTCTILYPINKVTISKYIRLKFSNDFSGLDIEKEVAKILSGLTEINNSQLLMAVDLFVSSFLDSSDEYATNLNKLIVEKCLSAKLFALVSNLHQSKQLPLTSDTYFELVRNSFWSFFNSADSLNENFGNLAASKQSLQIMDSLSYDSSLNTKYKKEILGIKHLFKAIANLKNFRVMVDRSKVLVPKMLLTHFGDLDNFQENNSSPLTLVTSILEQNSKAYYAFEKLFKIVNDILIYHENTRLKEFDSHIYFTKLKSACIESALLDNNFNFAYTQSLELIEYFTDRKNDINDLWLTFYQVGKYVSPTWFDNPYSNHKIEILLKQRSVLALTMKMTTSVDSSINNSKIIISQWTSVNSQIKDWYDHWNSTSDEDTITGLDLSSNLGQNLSSIASDLIDDASKSTNQASEKLSGLLVSGIGWAIGASK